MIAVIEIESIDPKFFEILDSVTTDYFVTSKEEELLKADKVIIPNFQDLQLGMKKLNKLNIYPQLKMMRKPVLVCGIASAILVNYCEKMRLPGLGVIDGRIENLEFVEGKKEILLIDNCSILNGTTTDGFYFSNEFYLPKCCTTKAVIKDHPELSAVFEKENFHAVTFTLENSGQNGITILKNFISL